jgi:hypothetical protein
MLKTGRSTTPRPAWSGAIAPARYAPVTARGRNPAGKAVGAFVPGLTRKVFENFGFSTASLITDWARIAGNDLAEWTVPERVKWPPPVDSPEAAGDAGARRGATLVLRVDPARALDVEYRTRQIIERINAYFGYRAVTDLRILQAPLPARPAPGGTKAIAAAPGRSAPLAAAQPEDRLAQALARMKAGVEAATGRG